MSTLDTPFFNKQEEQGEFILKPTGGTSKVVVSEADIKRAIASGRVLKILAKEALFTPFARDLIKSENIRIEFLNKNEQKNKVELSAPSKYIKSIAIGSDHRGYPLKEHLKTFLIKSGYKVIDVGTYKPERCDYPDFAYAVANKVATGEAQRGIMIDSMGIASCMVVNKVKGVRGAMCNTPEFAKASREHNDANVLTLGGDIVACALAEQIVKTWLTSEFLTKYTSRLKKVKNMEEVNFK